MKKILLLLLTLTLAKISIGQQPDIKPADWRTDIDFLLAQLVKTHPAPNHRIAQTDLSQQAQALKEKAGKVDGQAMAVGLMRLLAQVGDGNTALNWQKAGFSYFPIRCAYFDDTLRVVATDSVNRRYLGMKVLKIDQYSLPEVQEKLMALTPVDESLHYAFFLMEQWLQRPEVLHEMEITDRRGNAVLMYEDDEGNRFKAPLFARPDEPEYWFRVQPEPPANQLPPFDAVLPGCWIKTMPEQSLAYLYLSDYPDKTSWKSAYKQLKSKLKESEPTKVLIDLRWNQDENLSLGKKIMAAVAKSKGIKKDGKIYVAIGSQTYAAATMDAYHWKEKYGALLIGGPTGANPNGYRVNQSIKLPNAGLTVTIPTQSFQLIPNHIGGLLPDVAIPEDWEDYHGGKDVVWEWVVNQ